MRWTTLSIALAALLGASSSRAQNIEVGLPTAGYFRPGRYMPVAVFANDPAARGATITLRADGALPTTVAMNGRSEVIVPMLMLSADARKLAWSGAGGSEHAVGVPLAPFREDELVVATDADLTPITAHFPGSRPIALREKGLERFADVAVMPGAVDRRRVADLLAAGVIVAGEDWIRRPPRVGPQSALAGIDAYSPTFAWSPGASARIRRMTLLCAILFSLGLLACVTLLHGRRSALSAAVFVFASVAGIDLLRRSVSPLWTAQGQIVVGDSEITQLDDWKYLAARAATTGSLELPENALPVFSDPEQARRMGSALVFDAARNALSMNYTLRRGEKLAVMSRRISFAPFDPGSISGNLNSPMIGLAGRAYRTRDVRILGQREIQWIDDQTVNWPSVVLKRAAEAALQ